jgi:hypothetical protein
MKSSTTAFASWSDEETEEPLIADHRNFYKVEKWSRDGQRVVEMVWRHTATGIITDSIL